MTKDIVVALTDYGLGLECAVFASLSWRGRHAAGHDTPFAVFFGATAVAALAGGTFHGFVPDARRLPGAVLWGVTLVAVGLGATAAWQVGARLLFSPSVARWVSRAATLEFLGYLTVVLLLTRAFAVAVANYLPAALFLVVAFGVTYRRTGTRRVLLGAAGLGLSIVASGMQQAGIGVHPVYFDHNALYHLLQAVALGLLFVAARHVAPTAALDRPSASAASR